MMAERSSQKPPAPPSLPRSSRYQPSSGKVQASVAGSGAGPAVRVASASPAESRRMTVATRSGGVTGGGSSPAARARSA